MDKRLLDELTRELLAKTPADYRPPLETDAVKRERLRQLDRDLNPELYALKPSPAEVDFVAALGGRICDMSELFLDMLANRKPATAAIRKAQKQVNETSRLQSGGPGRGVSATSRTIQPTQGDKS